MKKTLFLFLFLSGSMLSLFAQRSEMFSNRNSLQLELGGHGLIYSLIYQRILIDKETFKTTGQIGIAYYPPSIGFLDFWMPVSINQLYRVAGPHHLEAGLGMIGIREAVRDLNNKVVEWRWNAFFSARIGYRYQKADSRFLWRVGLTPIMETDLFNGAVYGRIEDRKIISDFHFLAGASLGYSF